MVKLVLIYQYGDEYDGGTAYKTFTSESKEKALMDLELEFDRVVVQKKNNSKKEQELENRIQSTNNVEKKRVLLIESMEIRKNFSQNESIKLGDFNFNIENVSYFDSHKNKLIFSADVVTLDEWFNRQLAK